MRTNRIKSAVRVVCFNKLGLINELDYDRFGCIAKMQNVGQATAGDGPKTADKVVHHDIGNSPSTPHSTSNSSPAKSETETYSEHRRYMSDTSGSEDDSVSEVRFR